MQLIFLEMKIDSILLFLKKTEKKRILIKSLKKYNLQFLQIIAFFGTFKFFLTLNNVKTFFILIRVLKCITLKTIFSSCKVTSFNTNFFFNLVDFFTL